MTMRSRERWLKTMRGERADRVPIAAPIWWDPLWRGERPEFEGLRFVCADCHVRTHDFGDDDCAKCHTPADDWGTCGATGKHPFPLDHGDTNCNCVKCHQGGDTSDYWCGICHWEGDIEQVHEAQDIHFTTGMCVICHPQGRVE